MPMEFIDNIKDFDIEEFEISSGWGSPCPLRDIR